MVAALLDTSVLVDILRRNQAARNWITQQRASLGITAIVWLEVIQGAGNKLEQNDALALLKSFEHVEIVADDFEWAISKPFD